MLMLALSLTAALDADAQLQQALRHAEAFEYDQAVPLLQAVAARPGLAPSDKAQALVLLGLVYAELRDDARASLAFEDAIAVDPLIVLPQDASPKTKALLESARARVRLRTLTTTTNPVTPPPPSPPAHPVLPVEPVPPSPGAPAGDGSMLGALGIGAMAVGGVLAVAGGAVWGVGLVLLSQAEAEPYQSDAAKIGDQSAAAQMGGQVTVGVGLAALAAGGVVLAVDAIE